jgi:hypothetical protein
MQFIETYWFIWLAAMVIFAGLAIHNQIRRIRNIGSFSEPSEFFNGIGFLASFVALAYASAGLLFLSIILNVISYAK